MRYPIALDRLVQQGEAAGNALRLWHIGARKAKDETCPGDLEFVTQFSADRQTLLTLSVRRSKVTQQYCEAAEDRERPSPPGRACRGGWNSQQSHQIAVPFVVVAPHKPKGAQPSGGLQRCLDHLGLAGIPPLQTPLPQGAEIVHLPLQPIQPADLLLMVEVGYRLLNPGKVIRRVPPPQHDRFAGAVELFARILANRLQPG